jgi:hypothetical protein
VTAKGEIDLVVKTNEFIEAQYDHKHALQVVHHAERMQKLLIYITTTE